MRAKCILRMHLKLYDNSWVAEILLQEVSNKDIQPRKALIKIINYGFFLHAGAIYESNFLPNKH